MCGSGNVFPSTCLARPVDIHSQRFYAMHGEISIECREPRVPASKMLNKNWTRLRASVKALCSIA